MSTHRRNRRGRRLPKWLQIAVFCVLLILVVWNRLDSAGVLQEYGVPGPEEVFGNVSDGNADNATEEDTGEQISGELYVYYLDVGQADCTILVSDGEALLIDAGNNDDGRFVVDFLEDLGVERLAYAIGTHSHEDHIGGLDYVIKYCDPETVIMPEEDRDNRTYVEVLEAIEDYDVTLLRPEVGAMYEFGDAGFQILGPSEGEKEAPNAYSVCLMVIFGENRFLFTGDAEVPEEKEMMASGLELECDVFQAGHHGSSTSNSREFLMAADPVYTVISCGKDNEYGHPHREVVAEFQDQDVQMYRTDELGTITAISDGRNIRWEFESSGTP